MRWVVVVGLVACSDPSSVKPPPPVTHEPVVATPPAPVRVHTRETVRWSNVHATDDCFFFSGPEGRDDLLQGPAFVERDAAIVKLTIEHAVFEGTYREGTLDLSRMSSHSFDGPWLVGERMHGVYSGGSMTIRYRYNECEVASECPGRCTIVADLILTPDP